MTRIQVTRPGRRSTADEPDTQPVSPAEFAQSWGRPTLYDDRS